MCKVSGRSTTPLPSLRILTGRSTTAYRCFLTLVAVCTWGMCVITPSGMWYRVSNACRVLMCFSRWAGMRLVCRLRMLPSSTKLRLRPGPTRILTRCVSNCRSSESHTTGLVSSQPASLNIIAGNSGFSPSSWKRGWLTRKWQWSTGIRLNRRYWLMNRSMPMAVVGAPASRSSDVKFRNGS